MKLERIALIALGVIAIAQGAALYRGRRALWEAHVATANAKAERDRTRVRFAGELAIAERLVVQGRVELTAALRREGQKDQALVRLRVDSARVRAIVAAAIAAPDSAREITLTSLLDARDSLGVIVGTKTVLRGFGLSGREPPAAWVHYDIARAPLQLDVALSCQGHDAVAQVGGPRWATLELRDVKQQPEICNPRPPAWQPFSFQLPSLPWTAGLLLVGIVTGQALSR